MQQAAAVTNRPGVLTTFASREFRRDPVPFLHWLREHEPVHRTEHGFYLVSRYADVLWLSNSSRDLFRRPGVRRRCGSALDVLRGSMVMSNPPSHTRVRRMVSRDFTARRVDGLRDRITRIADRALDVIAEPLSDGEPVDLHHSWSLPMTAEVMSELLGVPAPDRAWLTGVVIDISDGVASGDAARLARADEQTARLAGYFEDLVALRLRVPQDDLVSAWARTFDRAGDFASSELFGVLWLLWLAGFESSASMIDHGALTLLRQPGQARWLRGGHEESLGFADEVLRHCVVQLFTPIPRITTEEVAIAGVRIPAGSDVRPVVAAANRDPRRFADPDRFDPTRGNAFSGFAFGQGPHRCVGAQLARTELAIGLSRLHARFPALVAAGELVMDPAIVSTRMTRSFPVALERS